MAETQIGLQTLPILPTSNAVLFPHVVLPLTVARPKSIAALEAAMATEEKLIGVFAVRGGQSFDQVQTKDFYQVGCKAVVRKLSRQKDRIILALQGLERIRIIETLQNEPHIAVRYEDLPLPVDEGAEIEAMARTMVEKANQIQTLSEAKATASIGETLAQFRNPLERVYPLASILSFDAAKEQSLLEAPTRHAALRLMNDYLDYEIQVLELQNQITSKTNAEITREQRDYVLRQQLKTIKTELGERESTEGDIELLREQLEKAQLPAVAQSEADRELRRLAQLTTASPEYQTLRSYLELVAELPWNVSTTDNHDLARAQKILDEEHFDLKEVKERILEQLAVMKLNQAAHAPVLLFVGPPGVGKTSLGASVAHALERRFERMSLGGLHDEAELRGHRRTYVGAMPGRIVQAIRRSGVRNPVIMLDEIDKIGQDFRGDPAAALMEILDPAQNCDFRDNYLDLPFDLSQVFFIATANSVETIPGPLLDRMEMLRLSGYTEEEKIQIAQRYIVPRRLKDVGLTSEQLIIQSETLAKMIRGYTREAGVRQLERTVGAVARKAARQFAEGRTEPLQVKPGLLHELLGTQRFLEEKLRQRQVPGVATGLAWTPSGGDILYIEAATLPKGRGLTVTGQIGSIMRESADAAVSCVWSHASLLGIPPERFTEANVHIHVPAGAIPKDGPSAGITMATAVASLLSGRHVDPNTAMTGEITLAGLVLPVGGIKEKVLAANRSGVTRVILPKDNKRDLEEVPQTTRSEMDFVFAETILDVWRIAIPSLNLKAPVAAAIF